MQIFLVLDMLFQLFYIRKDFSMTFLIFCHAIQIQHRLLCSAADTYRIPVVCIVSRILDIERSSMLLSQTVQSRHRHLIASHLQSCHLCSQGIRFRMILRCNKLQRCIRTCFERIVPYINDELLTLICSHTQRLPSVQSAKAEVSVFCRRDKRRYFQCFS